MRKLIWRIRYALRIREKSKGSWLFCFEAASIAVNECNCWREDDPEYAADEEMSYWND